MQTLQCPHPPTDAEYPMALTPLSSSCFPDYLRNFCCWHDWHKRFCHKSMSIFFHLITTSQVFALYFTDSFHHCRLCYLLTSFFCVIFTPERSIIAHHRRVSWLFFTVLTLIQFLSCRDSLIPLLSFSLLK